MYDGTEQDVTLKCENELMKHIIGHFGESAETEVLDEEHFSAHICVSASLPFWAGYSAFPRKCKSPPRNAWRPTTKLWLRVSPKILDKSAFYFKNIVRIVRYGNPHDILRKPIAIETCRSI